MDVHRFEKIWIAASIVLIVAWIGTVTYGAVGPPGIAMIDDSGGTVDQRAIAESDFSGPNFREPGVYRTGEDEYAVYVVSRQFAFEPGSGDAIEVPADSRVTFHVTSADVVHGFSLVGTNVNAMVIPGQVTEMTVEFDGTESYGIVCNEYCGAGHHTMAGTLEVVPQSQFEASGGTGNGTDGTSARLGDASATGGEGA